MFPNHQPNVDMLFLLSSYCVAADILESSLKAAKIQRVKEERARTTLQVVRDRLFLQAQWQTGMLIELFSI